MGKRTPSSSAKGQQLHREGQRRALRPQPLQRNERQDHPGDPVEGAALAHAVLMGSRGRAWRAPGGPSRRPTRVPASSSVTARPRVPHPEGQQVERRAGARA